jgi:hypothetical protein
MEESAPASSPQLLVEWAQDATDTERQRQRQQQQVRFNEQVRYRIIEDTSRMSSREIHSTWYQEEEFGQMRRDTKKSVKRMLRGHPEDNATRSYRGLEHLRSQDILLALQEERERLIHAVLRRQDRGATPHDLACTASRLSRPSADRALRRGRNDAVSAATINTTSLTFVEIAASSVPPLLSQQGSGSSSRTMNHQDSSMQKRRDF